MGEEVPIGIIFGTSDNLSLYTLADKAKDKQEAILVEEKSARGATAQITSPAHVPAGQTGWSAKVAAIQAIPWNVVAQRKQRKR